VDWLKRNNTDLAISLHSSPADSVNLSDLAVQSSFLQKIVFGNLVRAHLARIRLSILDQDIGASLYQQAPKVGKNDAEPLTARASIDARINPKIASKADIFDKKRLSPRRTITRDTMKTIIPRREI
jgi:hypothetical protein